MVVRLPHLALTARLANQANARALRQVVDAGATTQRRSAALPALIAVAVCSVLSAGLRAVSTAGNGRLEHDAVERVATEIHLTASAKVETAPIEDPGFHRRAESARTGILASALTRIAYAATFSVLGLLLWTGAMPLAVGGTTIPPHHHQLPDQPRPPDQLPQ
ncbi:hypothetical protein ADK86_39960 [Streptomyces sp. NRRL F-5755]|uniref:hypothetical protein n=1 Tax=Streptomyces sp. NRRL F-5755 TaxID=1519475 RepID=UPI0006AE9D4D|nr:hypothetical protein [Streptomyces sp. NRRL F-5755]KOT86206.1 hypothetical protein ADK86_39960 [Streptomyces sp. NRRL F-5755]